MLTYILIAIIVWLYCHGWFIARMAWFKDFPNDDRGAFLFATMHPIVYPFIGIMTLLEMIEEQWKKLKKRRRQ